jgi:N-acetylmuramoyl-L-alanine amidase
LQVAQQVALLEQSSVKSVILDAGHGGEDGGAVGKSELPEKYINLSITKKLQTMLEAAGFEVLLTRETDSFIGDNSLPTLDERRKSDMQKRLEMITSHPNSIFVSIHQNHFDDAALSGAQVFYSSNDPNSAVLASSIQTSFRSMLQPENERESKISERTLYLMKNAMTPAVIVECGFLSNASEAKLLCEDAYQNKVAFSIFCGILEYYNTTA